VVTSVNKYPIELQEVIETKVNNNSRVLYQSFILDDSQFQAGDTA
jgi:hypothetical protein